MAREFVRREHRDGDALRERVGARRHPAVHLHDLRGGESGCEDPADAQSRERVRFRERVHRDRIGVNLCEFGGIVRIDQLAIDLVVQHVHGLAATREQALREPPRRRFRHDASRRIVRRTDHDQARRGRYRCQDCIRIKRIRALRVDAHALQRNTLDLRDLHVHRKARVDHEHGVLRRIDQRAHRDVDRLLRARRDAHVVGGVTRIRIARRDRLAQVGVADVRGIGAAVLRDPRRRRLEVRDVREQRGLPDAEVDRRGRTQRVQRPDRRSRRGFDRWVHTATPKSRIALSSDVLRSVEAPRSPMTSAHGT